MNRWANLWANLRHHSLPTGSDQPSFAVTSWPCGLPVHHHYLHCTPPVPYSKHAPQHHTDNALHHHAPAVTSRATERTACYGCHRQSALSHCLGIGTGPCKFCQTHRQHFTAARSTANLLNTLFTQYAKPATHSFNAHQGYAYSQPLSVHAKIPTVLT